MAVAMSQPCTSPSSTTKRAKVVARHLAERGGDGPVERPGRGDGGHQVAEHRGEATERVAQVGILRRLASVGGREGGGAADHVLEDAAHGEVVAGRRVVELVGRDAGDDAAEVGAELLELRERVHGSSS